MEDLPEEILANILARLPFRSIACFKSVCKDWKSLIESRFFRDLFWSLNRDSSSSSWSLMYKDDSGYVKEAVAHYGREEHRLSRSLGSYTSSFIEDLIRFKNQNQNQNPKLEAARTEIVDVSIVACTDGLALLYLQHLSEPNTYYVCNPVLRQWVQVPPPDPTRKGYLTGLATRVDKGVVSGYKVVRIERIIQEEHTSLGFQIYSSETGEWTNKIVRCPCPLGFIWDTDPISLNGNLHWLLIGGMLTLNPMGGESYFPVRRSIMSHDFYATGSDADRLRIIPLPDAHIFPTRDENVCTTSGGFLMYLCMGPEFMRQKVRVWKLKSQASEPWDGWELLWEMNPECIGFGLKWIPTAMHPFDSDVIYMLNPNMSSCLVSLNMQTQEVTLPREPDRIRRCHFTWHLRMQFFSQFILPRWFEPIPHPLNMPLHVLPP